MGRHVTLFLATVSKIRKTNESNISGKENTGDRSEIFIGRKGRKNEPIKH